MANAQIKIKAMTLLQKGMTLTEASRETGLSEKTLKRYRAIYVTGGEEALLKPGNRYYQTGDKIEAVQRVMSGKRVSEVAAAIGSTEHSVRNWVRMYETGGKEALVDQRRKRRGCHSVSAEEYALISSLREGNSTNESS